jgi:PKD repeat protein
MKLKQTTFILVLCLFSGNLMAQTVNWFAGIENKNDNDPHLKYNNIACNVADAYFFNPEGIAWDKNGNMWITERNKIRLLYNGKFNNRAGALGDASSSHGYTTKSSGIQASFYAPSGIVADASGVLYIVDCENHAIRRMDAFTSLGQPQEVTIFAGAVPSSSAGTPGIDNGLGTNAKFDLPKHIARDANGNFYVTEFNNFTVRKITPSGDVSTLAGSFGVPGSKDGIKTAATFGGPYGVAVLDNNYILVSDFDNGTIRSIHMTTGDVKTLYGVAGDNVTVDGTLKQARFKAPRGIAVVNGKIYVCDESVIREIDPANDKVTTFAGSKTASGNVDGEAGNARFGVLGGIAYDGKVSLYVTDLYYNNIRKVKINSLAPTVNFTASKTSSVLVDEVVSLTNTSAGVAATSMLWTITSLGLKHTIASGSVTSSPVGVKFQDAGFYDVKLKVTNPFGSDSLFKGSFISVSTTGISIIDNHVSVGVYPNPSVGEFTLQSLYGSYPIQSFEVFDVTGKSILNKGKLNSLSETFNIAGFSSGFYFVKVTTTAGSNTLKLQKI